MSDNGCEDSLSDDDLKEAIDELRYVLRNAADKNPVDRQLIMGLTRALEGLTELRINRAKRSDPRLGGAKKKIEEAKTRLDLLHGRIEKHVDKPRMDRLTERLKIWK
jgi:hypothetical protein